MQGRHVELDAGLGPAPGEPNIDPATIIDTHRLVQVYREGRWVAGTVLAWHYDRRGWRCLLDWIPQQAGHYRTRGRYDPEHIRPHASA